MLPRMNKPRLAIVSLALLSAPLTAAAQTVIVAPWAAPTVVLLPPPSAPETASPSDLAMTSPADASRLRFGLAGNLTVGLANLTLVITQVRRTGQAGSARTSRSGVRGGMQLPKKRACT